MPKDVMMASDVGGGSGIEETSTPQYGDHGVGEKDTSSIEVDASEVVQKAVEALKAKKKPDNGESVVSGEPGIFPLNGTPVDGERSTPWFGKDGHKGGGVFGAAKDLKSSYDALNAKTLADWEKNLDLDKYYHCEAHCEATNQGPQGEVFSEFVGDAVEAFDRLRGDTETSCRADLLANEVGREFARRGIRCDAGCSTVYGGQR